ncbi:MAG TPA: twin-arginine translocase subunit TatC [Candidatus Thermoplasmatota archaeon]|nr:twin-arginine translocase subunit TatC [Candidatus Thermoplasmatota archaeon]
MQRALVPALLVFLLAAPAAQAATVEGADVRLYVPEAGESTLLQTHRVVPQGIESLPVGIPAGYSVVQVLVDGRPVPWHRAAHDRVLVHVPDDAARADVIVVTVQATREAAPGPVSPQLLLPLGAASATARIEAPESLHATIDGQALRQREYADLAPGAVLSLDVRHASLGLALPAILGALLALVLAGTLLVAARDRLRATEPMGYLGHLRELSFRLKVVVAAVLALTFFTLSFAIVPTAILGAVLPVPQPSFTDNLAARAFREIVASTVPPGVEVIVTSPVAGALAQIEVALVLGLLLASPVAGYQAAAFLAPALAASERRFLLRLIPAVTGLFAAGAAFAYYLLVPTMLGILYLFTEGIGARPLVTVDALVGFVVVIVGIFAFAFQLPVLMWAASRLGFVSYGTMARLWRHAVLAIVVLAAIVTPDPTLVGQAIVAVPLCALYGVGLLVARRGERARAPAALALPVP